MSWTERTTLAAMLIMACWAARAPAQDFDEGADERMRRVVKILRSTNKAQVNQFVPVAFDLKHVNPYALIRFIRRPIEAEEGNWWTFVHPDGDKGRLLINVPIWLVEPMTELIALLDRPGLTSSSGDKRVYHKFRHRDPGDPGVLDIVAANMTDSAVIIPDRATGAMYLEDAPSGVDAALSMIMEEMDFPTRQVRLRVKIYEIDVNNDGTLGLDYHAWKNGPGRNLFAVQAFSGTNARGPIGAPLADSAGGLPSRRFSGEGGNFAYLYDVPSAFFDFLTTKGKARVLTEPQTTVRNTETAVFRTGEEIFFYRADDRPAHLSEPHPDHSPDDPLDPLDNARRLLNNRTLSGATIARAIPDVAEFGIELVVTPTISENNILLDIFISNVSHLGFDGAGTPMLQARNIETEIRVDPGAEYIIGGLTRVRAIQSVQKVPILGSIPILGRLFGRETTTAKKTQAVIVLSAEIVELGAGLDSRDRQVVHTVETPGMEHLDTPDTPWGFEMIGMDHTSQN